MNNLIALCPQGVRRAMQQCVRALYRSFHQFILPLLLVTAGSSTMLSQQFAAVNLSVSDPTGRLIAGANVSIRSVDMGVARTGVSDKLGLAVISGLPTGQYKFTAEAEGFGVYQAHSLCRLVSRPPCKSLSESALPPSKSKFAIQPQV